MSSIRLVYLHISRITSLLGCISVVVLAAIAAGNMLMRMIYKPIHGSYELIGFFGATSVGLALAYTQLRKDHIMVTIISDKFKEGLKRNLERFSYVLNSVFFSICGWQTFKWGNKLAKSGELSETLKIVYYPFVYVLAIGFFIMALALIFDFLLTFERRQS